MISTWGAGNPFSDISITKFSVTSAERFNTSLQNTTNHDYNINFEPPGNNSVNISAVFCNFTVDAVTELPSW